MLDSLVETKDGQRIAARFFRPRRRWCLDPGYAVGAEGEAVRAEYAAVRAPIVSIFRAAFESSLWRPHLLPELT